MLKLCDDIKELDFLPDDPYCAKITALALTYGTNKDFARFYVQGNSSALSIIDGNVTGWFSEETDFEEVKEFLSIMGYSSLQCSEEAMLQMDIKPDDSSYIVKYSGEAKEIPENFSNTCDLHNVHKLLIDSGFNMGSYTDFVSDICPRINKKTAALGCIISGNEVLSCAFRLFQGNKSILLGAVATDKKYRGLGLASKMVPYMADTQISSYLFCRNDSLLEFYKKCGFTQFGRWAFKGGVL